jgi:hypothetical protein
MFRAVEGGGKSGERKAWMMGDEVVDQGPAILQI